jgi:hypothetical protein
LLSRFVVGIAAQQRLTVDRCSPKISITTRMCRHTD